MTRFFECLRDDGTKIVVEFEASGGESASYSYGGVGTAFDTSGCAPEVSVVDCWLKADENSTDAPSCLLTDQERERIEEEIAVDPSWQDDDGSYWDDHL